MRLGLNLGYLVAGDAPRDQLRLTRHAEALGFDVVWAAEAYGSDSPTVLAWLAGQTTSIGLGSAVMQIPGRSPAMTAMTAASLDLLSAGRFRLGLGVSGPQVSEGWHGVRFAAPLARTREYLSIVRTALERRPVRFAGEHYTLPLPDGPGIALRLAVRAPTASLPVYLAAVGPRSLEVAGELADGWLAVFYAVEHSAEQLAGLAEGLARSGRTMAGFDVAATFPLVVGDDPQRCADAVRPYAALYLGGMGSRQVNFYNALAKRMGYAEAAGEVQRLFLDGRHREAAAAVPYEFLDATSLLGSPQRIADRMRALAGSGVTTAAVMPMSETLAEKTAALTVAAEALALSGVGG